MTVYAFGCEQRRQEAATCRESSDGRPACENSQGLFRFKAMSYTVDCAVQPRNCSFLALSVVSRCHSGVWYCLRAVLLRLRSLGQLRSVSTLSSRIPGHVALGNSWRESPILDAVGQTRFEARGPIPGFLDGGEPLAPFLSYESRFWRTAGVTSWISKPNLNVKDREQWLTEFWLYRPNLSAKCSRT